jgi:hypothetical protein
MSQRHHSFGSVLLPNAAAVFIERDIQRPMALMLVENGALSSGARQSLWINCIHRHMLIHGANMLWSLQLDMREPPMDGWRPAPTPSDGLWHRAVACASPRGG